MLVRSGSKEASGNNILSGIRANPNKTIEEVIAMYGHKVNEL
jgi:hypothetical protein